MTHTVGDILPVPAFLNTDLLELPDFSLEKKIHKCAQNPFVFWSFFLSNLVFIILHVYCEEKHFDIITMSSSPKLYLSNDFDNKVVVTYGSKAGP